VTRRRWWAAGAAGLVAAAVLTWLWWPSPPAPRARQYLAFTGCLLTDARGVSGGAAPVWAGLGDASLKTRAKVQYLPVFGEQTTANAVPYLSSLIQRHCDVIFAVGDAPVAAAVAAAPGYPKIRFVVVASTPVAGSAAAAPSNVTRLDAAMPDRLRPAVASALTAAVARSG
jgi:basic membrane lipoprotein Med (substrate-binding protein (PBP1-ABC) superfamily)